MGYVKFKETIGDISKTYEFGSYEDFKDWENKLSGILVSAAENVVEVGQSLFKIGDKVQITQTIGKFVPGDIAYVRSFDEQGEVDSLWTDDKQDYWYVDETDFVRYEE